MKLEVILKITQEGEYNSFLTVHVEDNVKDDDDAVEKALDYAINVLGIEPSKLQVHLVDELEFNLFGKD